jgi:iron complex transport system permease protein
MSAFADREPVPAAGSPPEVPVSGRPPAPPVSGLPPTGPVGPDPREPLRHSGSRRIAGLVAALGLLVVVLLLSVAVGARTIPLDDTWRLLRHDDGSSAAAIIHDLRLPRTVAGLLVGAALGLSGGLMQAITRNPLAEPGLLGVNLGASTGVVIAIAFVGVGSFGGYVWFALAGAGLTSAAVFALGATGRSASPERLVLSGIAITAVLGSFVHAVLTTDAEAFDRYRYWDVGSLADLPPGTTGVVLPFLVVGAVIALALTPALNALGLGEETGRALGAHLLRTRALGMLAVTLLCGAATAVTGPIWFVGLAVPHVARMVTGPDQRWILLYSMILAPALLLAADVLGRVLVAPSELEVGIVTAFLGAPVFIHLARRRTTRSL